MRRDRPERSADTAALVSCPANSLSTESAAEARPLGAPTANTELYLREAQRRGRASAAVECQ